MRDVLTVLASDFCELCGPLPSRIWNHTDFEILEGDIVLILRIFFVLRFGDKKHQYLLSEFFNMV